MFIYKLEELVSKGWIDSVEAEIAQMVYIDLCECKLLSPWNLDFSSLFVLPCSAKCCVVIFQLNRGMTSTFIIPRSWAVLLSLERARSRTRYPPLFRWLSAVSLPQPLWQRFLRCGPVMMEGEGQFLKSGNYSRG